MHTRVIADITQESAEIAECAANSRAGLIAVTNAARYYRRTAWRAAGPSGAMRSYAFSGYRKIRILLIVLSDGIVNKVTIVGAVM